MLSIVYHRTVAKVDDYREFVNEAEYEEWLTRQEKLEPIIVKCFWYGDKVAE